MLEATIKGEEIFRKERYGLLREALKQLIEGIDPSEYDIKIELIAKPDFINPLK